MSSNDENLRSRVRQVIGETGLTHVQFASEVQLDPDKLSKSLTGVRRFTTYELAVIAERGRATVDWLLTGAEPERRAVAARAQLRGVDSSLDDALRRADEIADVSEILRRLKILSDVAQPLPTVHMTGLAVADGPRLAGTALTVLSQRATLAEFRDDPATVIEQALGIHVLVEPFGAGFDGLAYATSSFRLAIVNSEIPWSRQRFTLLHECGHILAGDGGDRDVCIDGDVMGAADRIEEMRANAFAAAALMPEDDVRVQATEPVTEQGFAMLAGRYRVSPDAMAWRLKSLGLIDARQRADLGAMPIQQAALRGGWTQEYRELTRTQGRVRPPLILADRAVDAFVRGKISARPVAALLRVDSATLLDWHASVWAATDASTTEAADNMAVFAP
jgi:Zn-dependent peptidase ImmA (M78 family)